MVATDIVPERDPRVATGVVPAPTRSQTSRGGDQGGLRAYNRRMILTVIRQHGALPKAEIARMTGLTAQSASVIVNALLKEKLVRKENKVRGKVGQPTTPIALNPDGALSVGVKIGRRSLEIALVDFAGTVIATDQVRYAVPRCREVMALLRRHLTGMLGRVEPTLRDRLVGIGVAIPGQLSGWGDVLGLDPRELREWDEVDIAGEIAVLTGLSCEIWNDATAACAAEMLLGSAITTGSALYFYVGTFIGGGVVLDGKLYEGPRRNAGALGSMPVVGRGGARFEQLIHQGSLLGLERALNEAGLAGEPEIRATVRAARDTLAWRVWRQGAAEGIAQAIAAALCVIDFESVVIDAMLDPEDVAALTDDVRRAMARFDLTGTLPVTIAAGSIGFSARALGAAILPLVRNFSPDQELLVKRVPVAA